MPDLRIPQQPKGTRTYAEILGARSSTPQEKQQAVRQGILRNPNTRSYTLPTGEVVSNRELQQRAMGTRFGSGVQTLEERARVMEQAGFRSPTGVKSNWVRGVQRSESWAKNMTYRQVERDPRFQNHGKGLTDGIYDHWLYLRNKHAGSTGPRGKMSGKYWADQRFSFLKEYHVLIWDGGGWVSP